MLLPALPEQAYGEALNPALFTRCVALCTTENAGGLLGMTVAWDASLQRLWVR
jgi:hypothetical protein